MMTAQGTYNKYINGDTILSPREIRMLMNVLEQERQEQEDFVTRAYKGLGLDNNNPLAPLKGFAVELKDGSIGYFLFETCTLKELDLTIFSKWCPICY